MRPGTRRSGARVTAAGRRSCRRAARSTCTIPTQAVDFRRFMSDEFLASWREQRDVIRQAGSAAPVTTNFMLPDLESHRAVELGGRTRFRRDRPLPRYHRRGRRDVRRLRGGPDPVLGRRRAVAADGAGRRDHPALRRAVCQQGAGPDAPKLVVLHRPRVAGCAVLPVAGARCRCRGLAFRAGPARRVPTRGSSGRPSEIGRTLATIAEIADAAGERPDDRVRCGDPLARRRLVGAGQQVACRRSS